MQMRRLIMNLFFYETAIGKLGIAEKDGKITYIFFNVDEIDKTKFIHKETDILKETNKQLSEYFDGELHEFSVPIAPIGTEFFRKSWTELVKIPYGETRSYKQIAENIGKPKAFRAVGMANNKNPIPIIIPCHRVIGANNKLVGYRGGLDLKVQLLGIEGIKK